MYTIRNFSFICAIRCWKQQENEVPNFKIRVHGKYLVVFDSLSSVEILQHKNTAPQKIEWFHLEINTIQL